MTWLRIVYQSPLGLTLVQQRSPVLKVRRGDLRQAHRDRFLARLWTWVREAGFAEVLIVSRYIHLSHAVWTQPCAWTAK